MPNGFEFNFYSPKEIKEHLDEYIIGQEEAKKVLSVAVYNHYKRIILRETDPEAPVDKSNVLIAGPTGCGKSAMIRCISEYLGVPFYIADATTLTQAGYVGDDVESILSGLIRNAGWNIPSAQYGIVAIDEIDKLSKRGASEHISRDVVGEGVQQALLKMVEGSVIGVPPQEGRKHPEQQLIYIDTSDILFIGMGAFSGIEDDIKSRLGTEQKIGFAQPNEKKSKKDKNIEENPFEYMCQEDLMAYGMIPEFIGRFPIITNVNALSKDDLKKILIEPKNSIFNQYKTLMALDNIELKFTDKGLDFVAKVVEKIGTGARGLKSLIESCMNELVFEYSGVERKEPMVIEITDKLIKKKISNRFSEYF